MAGVHLRRACTGVHANCDTPRQGGTEDIQFVCVVSFVVDE